MARMIVPGEEPSLEGRQLITVWGSVPAGYERDIVQEEIERLEKLIRTQR